MIARSPLVLTYCIAQYLYEINTDTNRLSLSSIIDVGICDGHVDTKSDSWVHYGYCDVHSHEEHTDANNADSDIYLNKL